MRRNISLLCCETRVTVISTISRANNSHLHETFQLNGSQSLGGSADRCVQVPWGQQILYKNLFCWGTQSGCCPRLSLGPSPSQGSWQRMEDLAPKAISAARRGVSGVRLRRVVHLPRGPSAREMRWLRSPPPRRAAPRAASPTGKDTQARSLETCRFLIKGNKFKNLR